MSAWPTASHIGLEGASRLHVVQALTGESVIPEETSKIQPAEKTSSAQTFRMSSRVAQSRELGHDGLADGDAFYEGPMSRGSNRVMWRAVARSQLWLSFVCMLAVPFLLLIIVHFGAPTRIRPFAIYDATISHPYLATETVHPSIAVFVPFIALIVTVLAIEMWILRDLYASKTQRVAACLHLLLEAISAFFVAVLATDVLKVGVGRLRPYFIAACQPKDAEDYKFRLEIGPALIPHDCTRDPGDGRHSFPSGHTSSSAVTIIFALVYVMWSGYFRCSSKPRLAGQHDMREKLMFEVGHAAALIWGLLLLSFCAFVGASRIIDYKHHPSDVITGFVLGGVVGLLFAIRAIWTLDRVTGDAKVFEEKDGHPLLDDVADGPDLDTADLESARDGPATRY